MTAAQALAVVAPPCAAWASVQVNARICARLEKRDGAKAAAEVKADRAAAKGAQPS